MYICKIYVHSCLTLVIIYLVRNRFSYFFDLLNKISYGISYNYIKKKKTTENNKENLIIIINCSLKSLFFNNCLRNLLNSIINSNMYTPKYNILILTQYTSRKLNGNYINFTKSIVLQCID